MATTTYYVGSEISKDDVYERIYSYTASSDIPSEDMETILRKISDEVNEKLSEELSEYFVWVPATSSIICNIDTQEELDMEWVNELIADAVGKYVDEYDEQHMKED